MKAIMETVPVGAVGMSAGGHSLSLYALDSRFRKDKLRGKRTERAGTGACPNRVQGFVPAEGLGCPRITGKLRFARATQ